MVDRLECSVPMFVLVFTTLKSLPEYTCARLNEYARVPNARTKKYEKRIKIQYNC